MCGIGVRVPGGQKQHHSGLQKRLHGLELPCDWEGGGWTSLVTTQLSDLGQDSGNRPRGCEASAPHPAELWGHLRSLPPWPSVHVAAEPRPLGGLSGSLSALPVLADCHTSAAVQPLGTAVSVMPFLCCINISEYLSARWVPWELPSCLLSPSKKRKPTLAEDVDSGMRDLAHVRGTLAAPCFSV